MKYNVEEIMYDTNGKVTASEKYQQEACDTNQAYGEAIDRVTGKSGGDTTLLALNEIELRGVRCAKVMIYDADGVYQECPDRIYFFCVQADGYEDWDDGSYDYIKAVDMLVDKGDTEGQVLKIDIHANFACESWTYDDALYIRDKLLENPERKEELVY